MNFYLLAWGGGGLTEKDIMIIESVALKRGLI